MSDWTHRLLLNEVGNEVGDGRHLAAGTTKQHAQGLCLLIIPSTGASVLL